MNDYLEKFLEQVIIKQVKEEKEDESLQYEFHLCTINSLIHQYNGKAYLSCWNDEKSKYFDAVVEWKKEGEEIKLNLSYDDHSSKEELGIYHWM